MSQPSAAVAGDRDTGPRARPGRNVNNAFDVHRAFGAAADLSVVVDRVDRRDRARVCAVGDIDRLADHRDVRQVAVDPNIAADRADILHGRRIRSVGDVRRIVGDRDVDQVAADLNLARQSGAGSQEAGDDGGDQKSDDRSRREADR